MTTMEGVLYPAKGGPALSVCCCLHNERLVIHHAHNQALLGQYASSACVAESKLGNLPREIYLPDGDKLVCYGVRALDEWLDKKKRTTLFAMESQRKWLIISLLLVPLSLYGLFGFLVPWAAVNFAAYVPDSVKHLASKQTLKALDHSVLGPSQLSATEKAHMRGQFDQVLAVIHTQHNHFNIVFRQGNIMGPNAFALPDGTIVFTDEIIELLDNQQDLLDAILLHEVGHVERNHAMQMVAESLFATIVISTYFGDVTGALDLFMGAGSTLVHNQFSQEHEWEADNYALRQLKLMHRDPATFAQAMEKLASLMPSTDESVSQWFSSHPHIEARIENAHDDNPP